MMCIAKPIYKIQIKKLCYIIIISIVLENSSKLYFKISHYMYEILIVVFYCLMVKHKNNL